MCCIEESSKSLTFIPMYRPSPVWVNVTRKPNLYILWDLIIKLNSNSINDRLTVTEFIYEFVTFIKFTVYFIQVWASGHVSTCLCLTFSRPHTCPGWIRACSSSGFKQQVTGRCFITCTSYNFSKPVSSYICYYYLFIIILIPLVWHYLVFTNKRNWLWNCHF